MKWKKTFTILAFALGTFGTIGVALAYEVAEVINGGIIAGKVTFSGTPPAPKLFEVKKNPEICGAERVLEKVEVNNGFLKGAVVVLEGVQKGKPFEDKSFRGDSPGEGEFHYEAGKELALEVREKKCNFGPFTGVLSYNRPVQFVNQDSIKHTLHTYAVMGRRGGILRTVHNRDIPANTEIEQIFQPKKFKKGSVVAITCDRHDFMENWFYVAETPYFSISGEDGIFTIDQIPPGEYELIVWHPVLGLKKQAMTVAAEEKVGASFEFSKN